MEDNEEERLLKALEAMSASAATMRDSVTKVALATADLRFTMGGQARRRADEQAFTLLAIVSQRPARG